MTRLFTTSASAIFALAAAFSLPAAAAPEQHSDFQTYEDSHPLTATERANLTPEGLKTYSQVQLDHLYATLQSGPYPDGDYTASVIFDTSGNNDVEKALQAVIPDQGVQEALKSAVTNLWPDKSFDRRSQVVLSKIGFTKQFPGKVFCGQSLLDSRRESVVLDYRYTSDLPNFNKTIGWLVSGKGLAVRDEIRMVRPGFYLGRAYLYDIFTLNFTLVKDTAALTEADAAQTCFAGAYTKN